MVPIIGPDAVIIPGDRGPLPLQDYLAVWVEALLELDPAHGPQSLNDVACRYIEKAGSQQIADVYWAVKQALTDNEVEPPESLRKLAGMTAFDLYVTTTFDDLLRHAVDEERYDGAERTRFYAYSPDRVEDLRVPIRHGGDAVVYHLLGRASSVPDYVVTEEDTLEFVHSLQSEHRRPDLLLDELRSRSLLIIGSGYSDWLARFFLRIAKRERLLLARSKTDVVADARIHSDDQLGIFLQRFSSQTRLYPGDPISFINELSARWSDHPGSARLQPVSPPSPESTAAAIELATLQPLDPEMAEPDYAIFISYASEDRAAALRLAAALEAAGLPVWLDRKGGLEGGDDYEKKIRRRIENASVFVPLLSPNVLTRQRRFFRLEWNVAAEVARRASETLPFIIPLRVADVPPDHPELPDHIRRAHWIDVDDTVRMEEAVARLKGVFRAFQLTLGAA